VALRAIRFCIANIVIVVAALAQPANAARAMPIRSAEASIPALQGFIRLVENGHAAGLRGVYAPALFAHPVIQQPAGDSGFVSSRAGAVTQFGAASRLGSIGLLAHNYLAGESFAQLLPGQTIYLVYGDGWTRRYVVNEIQRYQALQPNSAYSSFVDLADGRHLGSTDLFASAYGVPGAVVLQTCIESEGISTWGRLFVVAEPFIRRSLAELDA